MNGLHFVSRRLGRHPLPQQLLRQASRLLGEAEAQHEVVPRERGVLRLIALHPRGDLDRVAERSLLDDVKPAVKDARALSREL